MKASLALEHARAEIEDRRNWCRGVTFDQQGRCCAVGALGRVSSNVSRGPDLFWRCDGYLSSAADLMLEGVKRTDKDPLSPIPRVNDKLGHRATLHMFDLAISMARADEAVGL